MSKALQVLVIISGLGFATWVAAFDPPETPHTQNLPAEQANNPADTSEAKRWLIF
ncbi:MAG: hypothetical protein AAFX40_16625 [Cyanobacteria bacterium J06639_1]